MEEIYMEMLSESIPVNQPIATHKTHTNMKYGYVTVEYNTQEVWFEDVWRYFGYEQIGLKDKIAVEFEKDDSDPNKLLVYEPELVSCDDISVCDAKVYRSICPVYFYHKHKDGINKFYNFQQPTVVEHFWSDKYTLNFSPFHSHPNNKNIKKLPSIYNCVYTYKENTDVFGLVKIKDSDTRSSFLLAYNSALINEEHAVFMLKHILQNKC
jgi:hypothetical protein